MHEQLLIGWRDWLSTLLSLSTWIYAFPTPYTPLPLKIDGTQPMKNEV
ncbi:MAG: hypothetical protein SAK29_04340 [Scytonema sp. PMC 1069.18]|nr:hypothetical protein [Scytonema sp. PMC 1069.18]